MPASQRVSSMRSGRQGNKAILHHSEDSCNGDVIVAFITTGSNVSFDVAKTGKLILCKSTFLLFFVCLLICLFVCMYVCLFVTYIYVLHKYANHGFGFAQYHFKNKTKTRSKVKLV